MKILIRQFMLKNYFFRVAHVDVRSWLYGPPTKNVAHPWSTLSRSRRLKHTPFTKKNVLNKIHAKAACTVNYYLTEVLRWELYNSWPTSVP